MTAYVYDPEQWTTRGAAAARYGVSVRTIDRLTRGGEVRRIRLPHRLPGVLVSVADLDAVLEVTA